MRGQFVVNGKAAMQFSIKDMNSVQLSGELFHRGTDGATPNERFLENGLKLTPIAQIVSDKTIA